MWTLVIAVLISLHSPQNVTPDLDSVLSRAIHYVAGYEAQLGNLIGKEEYIQNAAWAGSGDPPYNNIPSRKKERRLDSDFLILQVGSEWIGVRNVNSVDGFTVKKKVGDIKQVFDDSPAGIMKTLQSIAQESAQYDIGDIERNTNLPTFALQILRPQNANRFQFEKTGEPKVDGVRTWAVNFREIKGPSMVRDRDNRDEFAHGTLWIEPDSGRILKTELNLGGAGTGLPFRSKTVVSYQENEKLEMLIPSTMIEHYDTDRGHTIDCRADYSNFRRFEVAAHLDFGAPSPPKPAPNY